MTEISNYCSDAWKKVNSIDETDTGFFTVAEGGKCARLENYKTPVCLKKFESFIEIEKDKTYLLEVNYSREGIQSPLDIYAMISLFDSDGKVTKRLYLNHVGDEKLVLKFESENNEKIRIELGIKRAGEVVFGVPSIKEVLPEKSRNLKVASVNIESGHGAANRVISVEKTMEYINEGFDNAVKKGADLICFAETIGDRGTPLEGKAESYETIDGAYCSFMKKKAKESGCWVFFSFHEKEENGERHNTAVLLDRSGEIAGVYRKTHLTIVEYERGMTPGNTYPVFDTEFGKVGMLVCWDAFFPEAARAMSFQGAELLLVSTAGVPHHRHVAHAMANGVYVAVAATWAEMGSEIIDPAGNILATVKDHLDCAFAEIDLSDKKGCPGLSVGTVGVPVNVYNNEYRPDLYDKISLL